MAKKIKPAAAKLNKELADKAKREEAFKEAWEKFFEEQKEKNQYGITIRLNYGEGAITPIILPKDLKE